MALFHFEIKSDKRKSGNRTSAKEHVTYIDREGKYRDIDQKMRLNTALVASSLRLPAPKIRVMAMPKMRYITMMLRP